MSSSKITAELVAELLEKQSKSLLKAVAKLLKEHSAAAAPVKQKKSRKTKAEDSDSETDSAPKVKRAPNEWIKFSQRVERMIRAAEEEAEKPKDERMRTVVVKQFASHLKGIKAYAEWEDDEIMEALEEWEPPTESKQAAKRKESAASAKSSKKGRGKKAAAESDSESESEDEKPAPKKPAAKKPAPKKQSKKAESDSESEEEAPAPKKQGKKPTGGGAAAAAAAASESEAEKPKRKQSAIKPKKAESETLFKRWTHEGTDYWRNKRGDVVSDAMDWVGHWDGKKINTEAKQPEDLATAEFEDN
jgi:nucleolin